MGQIIRQINKLKDENENVGRRGVILHTSIIIIITRTFARALLRDYFYSIYIEKYNLPFCIHKIIFGKSCPQYLCLDQLV
jgi:hypothetical protein